MDVTINHPIGGRSILKCIRMNIFFHCWMINTIRCTCMASKNHLTDDGGGTREGRDAHVNVLLFDIKFCGTLQHVQSNKSF